MPPPFFIEKVTLYTDECTLLYVFVKIDEHEKFDMDNGEHRKRCIRVQFANELIKKNLSECDIDQLVEGYQLVYRVQHEEIIDYFQQILKMHELQEILDYMDAKIELGIYGCINIDAYLN